MIINFDIFSDFWADSQMRVLFKDEYKNKTPSNVMWALFLYIHPLSKFFELDIPTREQLIKKDYLQDQDFDFKDYDNTLSKIVSYLPNTSDRFLVTWNKKLNEINTFLDSKTYDESTYEILTKVMKDFYPMMKQYREIVTLFQKEQEIATHGNIEESLSEKGLI